MDEDEQLARAIAASLGQTGQNEHARPSPTPAISAVPAHSSPPRQHAAARVPQVEQRDVQRSAPQQQPQAQGERLCLLNYFYTGLHKSHNWRSRHDILACERGQAS